MSDPRRRIVAWNRGAEELLRLKAAQVLDKPCFEVVRGKDSFGNRFCSESCPVAHMARRGEPIHSFTMQVAGASGDISARCSIILLPGPRSSRSAILHLIEAESACEEHAAGLIAADPDEAIPVAPLADSRDTPPLCKCTRGLTPREVDVLRLLAGGLRAAEIGRALGVSTVTARNHIQHTLEKLEAHSRLQAVLIAKRSKLI